MQYITIEVAQLNISPELRITLKEHGGSIPHHEYRVEAKENGVWVCKDKSYLQHMNTDKEMSIIRRWADKLITSSEAKRLLNIK